MRLSDVKIPTMKHIATVLFLFSFFLASAQKPINVTVSGNIFGLKTDTIKISQFTQMGYVDYIKAPISKKGDFTLKGKLPAKDYYVLRVSGNEHLNLILRDGADIKIYGDGANINAFHNIVGSEETSNMNAFVNELRAFNQKKDSANAYLQKFPDQFEAVNQSFSQTYYQFNSLRQKFIAENPNSPALIPTLSTMDPAKEFSVYEAVVNQLIAGFDGSPTIEQVKLNYQQLKAQNEAMDFLAPGKIAPDFAQPKADGSMLKLSDLKGKVVLIDFWASWCGPCRKENPNVVNLYKKYEKDGFTVLSVSLDKAKEPWLAAIEKDQLSWPNHVSDLKFWSNEAAQLYKVTGIPFTVLVDREGKVISTKLRGPDLENTLKGIFGH